MNYRDEYRDRSLVQGIAARIGHLAAGAGKNMTFMEVCGTHTMAIYQHGICSLLPSQVRLISGPGCPVCVTTNGYVDRAVAYCRLPGTIVATFGDMMGVPGTSSSLMEERARGADVRVVYSPMDAVALARVHPEKRLIFLGVGFETTAPTVAGSILFAEKNRVENYHVLAAHKTVPITMELLSADPGLGIDGYLCPAHVSTIIGGAAFGPLAERHGIPCVITGFEAADILRGVEMLVRQVVEGKTRVENEYGRVVRWDGNGKALEVLRRVFDTCDAEWRGLGLIPGSGLAINDRYARFDAERTLPVTVEEPREHLECRCGDILRGRMAPFDCPLFASACTPESPVGACMVSTEGTCAAAFKYGR
jgi:hydrogenase expression/formation protein HypD